MDKYYMIERRIYNSFNEKVTFSLSLHIYLELVTKIVEQEELQMVNYSHILLTRI